MDRFAQGWTLKAKTAVLVLPNGAALYGYGFGAEGVAVGEVCFNTAMTGYQEIMTDPSYAGQIVTFTFPHIGNVGANPEDVETAIESASQTAKGESAVGLIVREAVSAPSNYRAREGFDAWAAKRRLVGLSGVDTRALTARIRDAGMFNAAIAYARDGDFDIDALAEQARGFAGLEGADLAREATTKKRFDWTAGRWDWAQKGFGAGRGDFHVVALDFGCKSNILRCLASAGCRVTVLPAESSAEAVLSLAPDGVFLSNGPGDPAATGAYAVETIRELVASGKPIFGICLGHQMLATALGARTEKMKQGHHGANHPVKDLATGKVEIVSMNHGFTVARDSLPAGVVETHMSLFDGTNCGIALADKPVFSVQYHPEASPGPQDSHYLFERFAGLMAEAK